MLTAFHTFLKPQSASANSFFSIGLFSWIVTLKTKCSVLNHPGPPAVLTIPFFRRKSQLCTHLTVGWVFFFYLGLYAGNYSVFISTESPPSKHTHSGGDYGAHKTVFLSVVSDLSIVRCVVSQLLCPSARAACVSHPAYFTLPVFLLKRVLVTVCVRRLCNALYFILSLFLEGPVLHWTATLLSMVLEQRSTGRSLLPGYRLVVLVEINAIPNARLTKKGS